SSDLAPSLWRACTRKLHRGHKYIYHCSVTPTNGSSGARPRPQFGQYASAEEQKASIKDPEEYFEQLSQTFQPQTEAQPASGARGTGSGETQDRRTTSLSSAGSNTGGSNTGGSNTGSHVEHPA